MCNNGRWKQPYIHIDIYKASQNKATRAWNMQGEVNLGHTGYLTLQAGRPKNAAGYVSSR